MINKNTKITVLMGGPSDEAEISRKTGKAIVNALSGLGYSVVGLEYHPECVLKQLQELNTEIVFLALHGKYGEDGTIQGLLELAGIPYTGSGVSSSAITMDKIFTAHIFKEQGIRMAKSMSFKE
ncbi:MAG: D-alanine--D-alanine ligase, partial [Dialister micraerophilus]|nr:D-alanine--D-alanine ligase [Dialister micraerophilus]